MSPTRLVFRYTKNALRMVPRPQDGQFPQTPMAEGAVRGPSATRPRTRWVFGALCSCAVVAIATTAFADDAQEYELGRTRFDSGQYEDAASRFKTMLDPNAPACKQGASSGGCRLTDRDLIQRSRAIYATTLLALKRTAEADTQIELLLRDDPGYVPNPAVFPQEVVDRFAQIRAKLRSVLEQIEAERLEKERLRRLAAQKRIEAQKKWQADVERMAAQRTIVEPNSRWVAVLPFGIGQFQNGDRGWGWFFLGTEVLAGLTTIVTAQIVSQLEADARAQELQTSQTSGSNPGARVSFDELNSQIGTAATVNRASFGAWAALTVIGIVQAQVVFVPMRTRTEQRPLPPKPSTTPLPTVSVDARGARFGLVGRF